MLTVTIFIIVSHWTKLRNPAKFMGTKNLIRRYPVTVYFTMTFGLSWICALLVAAPSLISGKPIGKMLGILMFPVMIIWPCIAGIVMTRVLEGPTGLRRLYSRMKKWKLSLQWYGIAILVVPGLILLILFFLTHLRSVSFAPNYFFGGIAFAIPAGFLEEIGWTGFAFPNMWKRQPTIGAGIVLGILWSLWHLPVIDFLGAASPHGDYLVGFFLAFMLIMTAMRLLIVWVYTKTGSILLAQIMHVVSTGSLVVFGPPKLSPAQETMWYALYGGLLWIFVLLVIWAASMRKEEAH